MKAIQYDRFGIDNLRLTNIPVPVPAAHEVLIKVEAVSLNYLDIALVQGVYNPAKALPAIPGADSAGVVVATGEAVTRWKAGDRVTTHFVQQWQHGSNSVATNQVRTGSNTPGGLAEFSIQPETALIATPVNLTSIEAASLPVAGTTAWTGLMEYAAIQPGHTVLTQGTGGVSLFALQIALAAGARVIATTGSPSKMEKLQQLGAHEIIDYKKIPHWHEEVKRLTGGEGVHATIDVAGAASIVNSVKSVRMNGFVGAVGFIGGAQLPVDLFTLVSSYVRLQGFSTGSLQSFKNFAAAIETNNIRPVIDAVFDMEHVQDAFRHMLSGNHFGKVIISL
ncbi:NAD(P)-dependent alcohol dehydrogenase [Chitinophaga sp. Mgbs1]|uniref:NAD(P)-dependent alcohol dehydrogenase n=1 Tax=Chitinophaga solisilvae TaxID=1233460 RepID=A0A3S1D0Z5_9BACT|nr:NAD(P)-dependent alcohol dehydrogenase [Chitinophaga solisilvae]